MRDVGLEPALDLARRRPRPRSQRTASSLAKATDVARKALSACLVISADSTAIHSIRSVKGWSSRITRSLSPAARTSDDHARRAGEGVDGAAQPQVLRASSANDGGPARPQPAIDALDAPGGADRELGGDQHQRASATDGRTLGRPRRTTASTSARSCSSTGVSKAIHVTSEPARSAGARREAKAGPRPGRAAISSARPGSATGSRPWPRPATVVRVGVVGGHVVARRGQARRGDAAEVPEPGHADLHGRALQEPRVRLEVLERPDHALADRQRRLPAERADLRAVEEDERAVADPAALAARVDALGRQAEVLADPADRVVHLAVLVGAQVEDVDLVRRLARWRAASRRCSPGRRGTTSAAGRCRAPRGGCGCSRSCR